MKMLIKKDDGAVVPSYAHEGDAGMDLYSTEEVLIKPGERRMVGTGIRIALPIGFEAQVRPKSGLALKHGLTVLNTPGTIDAGYRGEIGVILINLGSEPYLVEKNRKIAQLVVKRVEKADVEVVDELPSSKRQEGGFGSTGV